MNLKQIEGFCLLAENLNFSKSAAMMYMSQPAFSRMISSMEEELGCKLIIRSKKNPCLTEVGAEIYKKAKIINQMSKEMTDIAATSMTTPDGDLTVGMPENGMLFFKDTFTRFHEKYPNVNINFREFFESDICEAVTQNIADVAFIFHYPEGFRKDTEGILLEKTSACLVVNNDDPVAARDSVTLADISDAPLVMVRKERSVMGYEHIMNEFKRAGISPHVSMFADSLAGTLSAVECGFGMTILASTFIIQERKNSKMKFIPIADAGEAELWMIWRKGREDILIEKMKETVMEIYADAEK